MTYKNRTEDEWFIRHEQDLIKNLKRERSRREKDLADLMKRQEAQEQKKLHWMKCPKCGSELVEEPVNEAVMIDQCTRCGGMYFDRGKLEDVLLKTEEDRRLFRIQLLHAIFPSAKSKEFDPKKMHAKFMEDQRRRNELLVEWLSAKEGKQAKALHWMRCSKCGSGMKEEDMSHGLVLDYCLACAGVFLDFGELELIAAFSEKEKRALRIRILTLPLTEK